MGMFDTIQLKHTRKHACCRRRIKSLQTKDLVNVMRAYVEGETTVIEHKLRRPTKKEKVKTAKQFPSLAKHGFPFLVPDKKKRVIIPNPQNTPFVGYDYCDSCESMSYLEGVFDTTGKLFILGDARTEREDKDE